MKPLTQCAICGLRYDPARRLGTCPHAQEGRDSAYLDQLKARALVGEPLKYEPWRNGEVEREALEASEQCVKPARRTQPSAIRASAVRASGPASTARKARR